jgi:hypothetical protein
MIRENFVEVRVVEPHPLSVIEQARELVSVLPGRVAVLCDPHVTSVSGILVASGKWEGSQDSDSGVVLRSGVSEIQEGDRVAFLPMHGLRCSRKEFDWVPEGCEIRFYGISCPVWDSIVGILEE